VRRLRLIFWPPTATGAERFAHVATTLSCAAAILWIVVSIQAVQHIRPTPGGGTAPVRVAVISTLAGFGGLLAASLLFGVIHAITRRRSRRLIQSLGFRLCPRCRYDLSASPPDGACPECGRDYTVADLQSLWKSAYRL